MAGTMKTICKICWQLMEVNIIFMIRNKSNRKGTQRNATQRNQTEWITCGLKSINNWGHVAQLLSIHVREKSQLIGAEHSTILSI